MVVAQHVLESGEVELAIVLRELSKADGAVLVDDAPHLDHVPALELLGVALELDDLHARLCRG